jgi:hypothetical protein
MLISSSGIKFTLENHFKHFKIHFKQESLRNTTLLNKHDLDLPISSILHESITIVYVDMQEKYVAMRLIYAKCNVNTQHALIYVDMLLIYVNMKLLFFAC